MSVEVIRHAAAGPASVALLLAQPPAQLVRRAPTGSVGPVRRNGVGFAAAVEILGANGAARGRLTIVPSTEGGCDVRITLSPVVDAIADGAQAWATDFLDSLARQARIRSFAA
jgi:hypothetical protein